MKDVNEHFETDGLPSTHLMGPSFALRIHARSNRQDVLVHFARGPRLANAISLLRPWPYSTPPPGTASVLAVCGPKKVDEKAFNKCR
jgi:hypothetical protein